MKDCPKIHPLLSLYLDGGLSPRDQIRVDRHLADCGDARQELDKLKTLRQSLLALPEPKMPHDLHERIMARLHGSPVPLPKPRPWGPWSFGLVAAAAMVTVILLNPSLLERKPSTVAQLPKALDEKTISQNSGTTLGAAQPVARAKQKDKSRDISLYKENAPQNSLAYAPENGSADFQAAVAPESKKAARMEKRESPPQANAAGTVANLNLPSTRANQTVDFYTSKPNITLRKSTQAAAESAPEQTGQPVLGLVNGTNIGPVAAAPALAPPTPNPTEGMLRTLTLSKEIAASSWSGSFAPVTVESQELITDADTFQQRWQSYRSGETPPNVDFTTQAVVLLTAGQEPTTGYSIHTGQLEEKADQFIVHYRIETPMPGQPVGEIITRPWCLQVIPKPTKPVVFQKD